MAVRLYSFVLAAAFAVFVQSQGINECHLAWAYVPNKACGNVVIWLGLNSTQIQEILNVHASNGESLEWSYALATRAQALVNQCGDKSNACSNYDGSQISVSREDSEESVSLTDMVNTMYGPVPEINIPNINIPDINIPEMNIPDINIPDFEIADMEFTGMDFPELNLPELDLSEIDLPANDSPDADVSDTFLSRKRRNADDENNGGTVGCGFIMYRTQGGISKHLACYYGDENGQGYKK